MSADASETGSDATEFCQSGFTVFDYIGTVEYFEVPDCGRLLSIEAYGAQGGGGRNGLGGGNGARIKGVECR